jgi:sec-independent protein translocase protein TatA
VGIGHSWIIALIILVIVLVLVGPGKISELGGALGRAVRDFRKTQEQADDASPDDKKTPGQG